MKILLNNLMLYEAIESLNNLTEKKLIVWKWVKAHAGNRLNELADKLATEAIIN